MAAPTRAVKCQVCSWTGVRHYGPDGILSEPCPEGHRVTYAEPSIGDQPVTPDDGTILPVKVHRIMTPEHKAKMQAARMAA